MQRTAEYKKENYIIIIAVKVISAISYENVHFSFVTLNFWQFFLIFIVRNCWETLVPVVCALASLGHSSVCKNLREHHLLYGSKYGLPKSLSLCE